MYDSLKIITTTSNLKNLGYKSEGIVDIRNNVIVGNEILSLSQKSDWMLHDAFTLRSIPIIRSIITNGFITVNLTTASIIGANERNIELASEICGKGNLVIEWVEETHSKDMVVLASKILRDWRSKYHVMLAIDDFGTGHDGFERFLLTKADIIKLNGELLIKARRDPSYKRAIANVCKWTEEEGSVSIAEWIETKNDLDIALECGASLGQGYYYA